MRSVLAATNRSPRRRLSATSILALLLGSCLSSAAISADTKVLRGQKGTETVAVFKDAYALDRFNKLPDTARSDVNQLGTLVTCTAPQGSRISVLGSGYRTAFVRVLEGSASGCEGTVPIGNVRDQ